MKNNTRFATPLSAARPTIPAWIKAPDAPVNHAALHHIRRDFRARLADKPVETARNNASLEAQMSGRLAARTARRLFRNMLLMMAGAAAMVAAAAVLATKL